MKMRDRKLLYELLNVQSVSYDQGDMIAFMQIHLEAAGMRVIEADGQLYARKGNENAFAPYFVAHADTVHKIVDEKNYAIRTVMTTDGDIVYSAFDPQTGQARGVGGDDKCGLFACLIAAQEMENVGVFIAIDEEVGCKGSRKAHEELFIRPGCFIQLDRRGNGDAVSEIGGPIASQDWVEAMTPVIENWGYRWVRGAITDVGELCPMMYLSGINLSAGYHSPHGPNEWVSETDLETSIDLALDIAVLAGDHEWIIPETELRPALPARFQWSGKSYNVKEWNERVLREFEEESQNQHDTMSTSQGYWEGGQWHPGKVKPVRKKKTKANSWVKRLEDLIGLELHHDAVMGWSYEHYVVAHSEHPWAEKDGHYAVSVPVLEPHNWELSDTTGYDLFEREELNDIGEKVIEFWRKRIEPHLDRNVEQDMQDAIAKDAEPITDSSEDLRDSIISHITDMYEDRAKNPPKGKSPALCDEPNCFTDWSVYDTDTRKWECLLHFYKNTKQPTDLQELLIDVGKVAKNLTGVMFDEQRAIARNNAEVIAAGPSLKEKVKKGRVKKTPEASPVIVA